jgi:hypothetical protein
MTKYILVLFFITIKLASHGQNLLLHADSVLSGRADDIVSKIKPKSIADSTYLIFLIKDTFMLVRKSGDYFEIYKGSNLYDLNKKEWETSDVVYQNEKDSRLKKIFKKNCESESVFVSESPEIKNDINGEHTYLYFRFSENNKNKCEFMIPLISRDKKKYRLPLRLSSVRFLTKIFLKNLYSGN